MSYSTHWSRKRSDSLVPMERRNPSPEELYARKWPIFIVTMIGLFMALIDVTIVNISLPEIQRDLDAAWTPCRGC